jgi:hypothetical protein
LYVKVFFSNIANSCPNLLKIGTQMYRSHMNDHVKCQKIRSETVDVMPVSMATIWPIIKDRPFLSMKSTLIPSNILEKCSLYFNICFIELNARYNTNLVKIGPRSMSPKLRKSHNEP